MSCLTAQFCNPRLPLFVQVAQTDSVRHLHNCGMLPNGLFSRHRLCSQLMSASCIHPGLGTVIDNLMQSFSDEQDPDTTGQPWQTNEYFPGAGMEIYEVCVCLWYCVLDSNGLCVCVCVCVCCGSRIADRTQPAMRQQLTTTVCLPRFPSQAVSSTIFPLRRLPTQCTFISKFKSQSMFHACARVF
jgi:hypothetical protein